MAYDTYGTIQRFWQRFAREELDGLPVEDRQRLAAELENRFGSLTNDAAGDDRAAFSDLLGLGGKGAVPFGEIAWPKLVADFDDAVVPSQLHAAAELYFIYQHERMGAFRVAEILRRLFRDGRMRIQRGPGARGLYLLSRSGSRCVTDGRTASSRTCAPSTTARRRGRRARSSTSTSTTSWWR
ncbi:MAG: hypothetical protein M5U07_16815 [Xanthobacteraceae bacterium]|nr:hypothetical protein [Xanthobacteraceae bacterium]